MRSNPVRRIFGWFGLVAMVPIGYMVYDGSMTPADGGTKAALVLIAVLVAVRLVEFLLMTVAGALERRPPVVVPQQPDARAR